MVECGPEAFGKGSGIRSGGGSGGDGSTASGGGSASAKHHGQTAGGLSSSHPPPSTLPHPAHPDSTMGEVRGQAGPGREP